MAKCKLFTLNRRRYLRQASQPPVITHTRLLCNQHAVTSVASVCTADMLLQGCGIPCLLSLSVQNKELQKSSINQRPAHAGALSTRHSIATGSEAQSARAGCPVCASAVVSDRLLSHASKAIHCMPLVLAGTNSLLKHKHTWGTHRVQFL